MGSLGGYEFKPSNEKEVKPTEKQLPLPKMGVDEIRKQVARKSIWWDEFIENLGGKRNDDLS